MLHYRIIGQGKPVLVLHGVAMDHRYMFDVMEPGFRETGAWKRIYADMPGHGQSAAQDDIRTQDDVLKAVMDFVGETISDEPFGLVGLSRGSYIARGIVHLIPERVLGVALISPGGNPSSDPDRLPPAQVLQADTSIRPELSENEIWAHENMSVVQRWDIVEKRRRILAPARSLFDAAQDARVMEAFDFSFREKEEARIFDGPSLIVAGRQDSISGYLDAMDLMHRFPRATLAVLDCAGHALGWERPEVFGALVRDWLARLATV